MYFSDHNSIETISPAECRFMLIHNETEIRRKTESVTDHLVLFARNFREERVLPHANLVNNEMDSDRGNVCVDSTYPGHTRSHALTCSLNLS